MHKNIQTTIADFVGEEEKNITPETNLYDDLNCDRLEVNDLMFKICHELKIDTTEEGFDDIQTVADIIQFCEDNSDEI